MPLSKIRIIRNRDHFGKLRKLNVYIDGNLSGGVDWDTSEDFPVPSGIHTFYVKMDWCRSAPVHVRIANNELVSFKVGLSSEGSMFGNFRLLFDLIFNFSNFYRLEKV